MADVERCILCGTNDTALHRGVVAPFLAQRIWNKDPLPAMLVQCRACEFLYFNPRLSDAEERRLYSGYRSAEYQQMRHATEPWYTEKLNASLFSDEAMQARRQEVGQILRKHVPDGAIRTMLDFGGSRGEMICDLLPGVRGFVYDISQVKPLPGITPVALDSGMTFDAVLCSNVFEHVASPRKLLREILSFCAPGSYVFIEVPSESPLQVQSRVKRLAQLAILSATHPSLAGRLVRLGTTNVMHEHLNFYSPKSLRTLLQAEPSLALVAEGGYGETIWILARVGTAS